MSKDEFDSAVRVIESCSGFTESDTPAGEAWEVVLARIADLESIVSRLPKTADGEYRVPNCDSDLCEAWAYVRLQTATGKHEDQEHLRRGIVTSAEAGNDEAVEFDNGGGWWAYLPVSKCYSTRVAAEAARTQEQEKTR